MRLELPPFLRRWLRRLAIGSGLVAALALCGVLGGELLIHFSADRRVHTRLETVPTHDVAVVLGTSKRVRGGYLNLHFANRMRAAAELYHAGKVRHILVSGANPSRYYDEPTDMLESLVELGVPAEAITRDYAGLRTLDTVVRARKIFGLERYIVVTDAFHTYRTVFLARHTGADCDAYAAPDVDLSLSYKTHARERLANVKALLDVYILRTQPKFLGPRETIQLAAMDHPNP